MSHLRFIPKVRINLQGLLNALAYGFLFLTFFNFVTRNYYWFFVAFALFVVTPKRKCIFNYSTLFLFIMGFSMLAFDFDSVRGITGFFKPFVFLMAYVMGTGLIPKNDDERGSIKHIEKVICLCAFGFFAHYTLNFIFNVGSIERDTIDIWTKSVLSSTGQASLATLGVAVIAAVLFSKRPVIQKIIASVIVIVIVSYNLILAGRTIVYMLAIASLVALLFNGVSRKKNIFSVFVKICIIFAVIIAVYEFNLFGIRTVIEESNLYQRLIRKNGLGIIGDLRFEYKSFYLEHFFEHPFGGGHIREVCMHYAHDLYLDSYDAYGAITLVAIIAYMLSSLVRLVKSLRSSFVSPQVKQLLLCTFVLLNIQFMLEPIMDGMPFLFVAYCLIDGTVSRCLALH